MFRFINFMALCPKCKDIRLQQGYTQRALTRFLETSRPIEGHCVICNTYWAISDRDRAQLAETLAGCLS